MKFKESFSKLGAVPGLDLKKKLKIKNYYFSTLLCFPKILWECKLLLLQRTARWQEGGGMWLEGVELDTA